MTTAEQRGPEPDRTDASVRPSDGLDVAPGTPVVSSPYQPPMRPLSGQGFQVDSAELEATASKAHQIGANLLDIAQSSAGSLAQVGPHGGWAISDALARCADAWHAELTTAGQTMRSVGDKLINTAASYRETDAANGQAFADIQRRELLP